MPPSRSDYLDYIKQRESNQTTPATSIDTALGMIKTAAVAFDHLTGSEDWNRYLGIVQEKYEQAKKERDTWLLSCGNAGAEDALRGSQLMYQQFNGRVLALEEILGLPHQVMESYRSVKSGSSKE